MTFQINTLHRGRFIWILLAGLFAAGFLLSYFDLQEIVKIIILLFCIPLILFAAVKISFQSSTWKLTEQEIHISRAGKDIILPIAEISYIKNHLRSGGNLLAIFFNNKRATLRIWRNKLFVAADDFESLLAELKSKEIAIVLG